MTSTAVTDTAAWTVLLKRLDAFGLDDIYFRPAYAALYARPGDSIEAFTFEHDDQIFLLPWVVRAIETDTPGGPAFDFETPYGYGGPLSTSDDPAFITAAWEALTEHCRQRGIICGFLRFHPLLDNHRWADPSLVGVVDDRQTVVLSLGQSPESVTTAYARETRNKVRKAEKTGVNVAVRTDCNGLERFAHLYAEHMAELGAHEDYLFGEDYFNAIQTLGDGNWRVYLAQYDGMDIGGALVLLSRRFAHYHLSSSLRAHAALAPNNLLRHAVTMDLLNSGRERLHYGGGLSGDPADSLLRFKAGYSPERACFRFGTFIADGARHEAIRAEWSLRFPHLVERFGRRLLCYRYRT
ncbi:hypothetical protein CCC_00826 [Paramagnetospirillum magnetotacticum MS-1]|uniref:BioF2-like acetyltransferase domain-containing protein n=1 Tax=Paramagnetospirillum magnetotacticum MS-1 TaxID=272627 RepID=A0A0C2YSR9_PARME|nr:GNAT family N-acetyltransferase [Paramagnetospirillum magnetotacticum]KIL97765.1 hypothetical protein CCC_00826 [Paramagnetospirillum magnetotacticum MS-1]